MRLRNADELTPGTLCEMRCARVAELLVDGEPYCIGCADDYIVNEAPPLWLEHRVEESKMRPLPPLRSKETPVSSPQLEQLKEAWRAFEQARLHPVAADADRCWAVLSAIRGTRCTHQATIGGLLCEKHLSGSLVPAQGWVDGAAAGELVRAA